MVHACEKEGHRTDMVNTNHGGSPTIEYQHPTRQLGRLVVMGVPLEHIVNAILDSVIHISAIVEIKVQMTATSDRIILTDHIAVDYTVNV